jgi:GT2 family glycosyltransferase
LNGVTAPGALAIVVVTHESADHILTLLNGLLDQLGPSDELVVVDNASADGTAAIARGAGARVHVIETGTNLGFGGGCHLGARATSAPLLLFINPDSAPHADFLDRMRTASLEQPRWGAWQAAVLMPGGLINTDGGVVHYLGIGWAGHCGEPLARLPDGPSEVAFASGAAMVVRRWAWEHTGGFDASYFLYHEDLDLGLRLWLADLPVGIVPDARVIHSYEFDRGSGKWFWLERNRWKTVLSVYPAPLLVLLAPALLGAELALLAVAARGGWLSAKLRAQGAVLRDLPATLRRRRSVQATRRLSTRAFALHLSASLDSAYLPVDDAQWAATAQAAYWAVVRRLLGAGAR